VVTRYFPLHGDAIMNVLVNVVGITRVALHSTPLRHLSDFPFTAFVQIYHIRSLNAENNPIVNALDSKQSFGRDLS